MECDNVASPMHKIRTGDGDVQSWARNRGWSYMQRFDPKRWPSFFQMKNTKINSKSPQKWLHRLGVSFGLMKDINSNPKTNLPSIWQLEHRNAFGFWDGGDDDGCCLVPTCSFFNHSCEPNCLHRMEHGEVRFYALRDIATDEELTFSYLDQAEVGHEWWVCRCFFLNTTSSS